MRILAASLLACLVFSSTVFADNAESAPPVAANAQPDGSLTLKGGSVAVGIGYTWGHGELAYGDGSHAFTISGISIVDVGVTNITASGAVYHLAKLADFAGNYAALGAGITVAGGASAVYLKNEHGVVIKLIATDVGLKFKLSADGVHVTLKS
jgi:hypothetical protein